jgi:flagellar protein FlbD
MIKVTRINEAELVINSDLIEFVEAIPDTMISLTTGKKIMVKESIDDIINRVARFKRLSSVRAFESPDGDGHSHGS